MCIINFWCYIIVGSLVTWLSLISMAPRNKPKKIKNKKTFVLNYYWERLERKRARMHHHPCSITVYYHPFYVKSYDNFTHAYKQKPYTLYEMTKISLPCKRKPTMCNFDQNTEICMHGTWWSSSSVRNAKRRRYSNTGMVAAA